MKWILIVVGLVLFLVSGCFNVPRVGCTEIGCRDMISIVLNKNLGNEFPLINFNDITLDSCSNESERYNDIISFGNNDIIFFDEGTRIQILQEKISPGEIPASLSV
ncbi:MAG: hypothetical protein AABX51_04430, partial [Nanoarchaeota archaeon]